MTDWLSNLWTLMDRNSECQHLCVFRDWIPDDAVESLLVKWLQPQVESSVAICPDCSLPAEDCTVIDAPSGRTMIVAMCRECGCRELPSDEFATARFDFEQIAAFLNSTLKLQGTHETRIAGHLWWLGEKRAGKAGCGTCGWSDTSQRYRSGSGSNRCRIPFARSF